MSSIWDGPITVVGVTVTAPDSVVDFTQPRLTETTARASPLFRPVVDASAEVLWIRTDCMAEQPQTPGLDRPSNRRLSIERSRTSWLMA